MNYEEYRLSVIDEIVDFMQQEHPYIQDIPDDDHKHDVIMHLSELQCKVDYRTLLLADLKRMYNEI